MTFFPTLRPATATPKAIPQKVIDLLHTLESGVMVVHHANANSDVTLPWDAVLERDGGGRPVLEGSAGPCGFGQASVTFASWAEFGSVFRVEVQVDEKAESATITAIRRNLQGLGWLFN